MLFNCAGCPSVDPVVNVDWPNIDLLAWPKPPVENVLFNVGWAVVEVAVAAGFPNELKNPVFCWAGAVAVCCVADWPNKPPDVFDGFVVVLLNENWKF